MGLSLNNIKNLITSFRSEGILNTLFLTPSIDVGAIEDYNTAITNRLSAETALKNARKSTNAATIRLIESANGAEVSTEALAAAQNASTVAARAGSVALRGLSIAMNMIASIAIAAAISAIVSGIDNLIHRTEKIKEAADEAQNAISDAQSTLKTMSDTISENKDRFLELSEGVDRFSHNIKLSEEDYAEYLSISQKLAEVCPSLIVGYDEQGNALLNIGSTAEETAQKLNGLLETQKTLTKQTLADNLDAVAAGVHVEVEEIRGQITQLQQEIADTQKAADEINFDIADVVKNGNATFHFNDFNDPLKTNRTAFINALESANISWEDIGNDQVAVTGFENAGTNGGQDGYEIRDIALKEAQEYYNAALNLENNTNAATIAGLKRTLAEKESLIKASYSKITASLKEWTEGNYSYQYLSKTSRDFVDALLPNIDWASLDTNLYGGADYENYINEHILNPLMSVPPENKIEINQMLSKLLSFEEGDLDILPFAAQLKQRLQELDIAIDITPLISDERNALDMLSRSLNDIASDEDGDYTSAYGSKVNAEDYRELQEYTKGFDAEDIELWNKVTLGAKNAADAINRYENAISARPDSSNSFTEYMSSLENLADGLGQLDKIYTDISGPDSFDWSSILNNEAFDQVFKDMENAPAQYKDVYDDFIKTISNSPDDITACQEAFDNLASAYIYNSGVLDNLTEENKSATIAFLQEKGVKNAEAVVTSHLANMERELALEKQFSALESISLSDATWQEINDLAAAGQITSEVAEQMELLALKKQWANRNTITTSADIKNLAELASASSKLSQLLNSLALAKQQVEGGINPQAMAATIASLEKQIDEYVNGNFGNNVNPIFGNGTYQTNTASTSGPSQDTQQEPVKETFDWIERKLEVLSEKTAKLGQAFDSAFTPSQTDAAYQAYLGQIEEEILANGTAISFYQDKLNSIGLSDEWISAIQNGSYSIDDITDETLKNQIQEYKTWYAKLEACQEKAIELEKQRLEIQNQYAQKIIEYQKKETEAYEDSIKRREKLVDLKETFGGTASKKDLLYQKKQTAAELNVIEQQTNKLKKLQATTTEGSAAWETYQEQIKANADSAADLVQSLAELADQIANLPLDNLDAYIDKNDEKKELYEARLGNATTASKKNGIINKEIGLVNKNNAKTQNTAKTTAANLKVAVSSIDTVRKSDKVTKTDDTYQKVQSYVKSKKQIPASLITKLGQMGYEHLVTACCDYNAALSANETAKARAQLSKAESKKETAELTKSKFDNVMTKYERKQGKISHKANMTSEGMDLAAAKGYADSAVWYSQLSSYETQKNKSLAEERAKLQKQLDNAVASKKIKKYSDEWWEMKDNIAAVEERLAKSNVQLAEFDRQMRQISFDRFDYLQEQISGLTSESDFYIDLMSQKDLTDDNGLTEYGIATIGLHKQNYDTYLAQAGQYGNMIRDIDAQLAENPYDTDLIAQRKEYLELQRQSILNAQAEKEAVIDLTKSGYEALYNSLSDVANEYLELIKNAQDAYSYQKNISEQTDHITSLQKKIAAYGSMSGNEEIAVKFQQANKELAEAEQNLQETLYEKYISDTETILNDLLNGLEAFINELANNEDELLNSINNILGGSDSIRSTLQTLSNNYGTNLSNAMASVWGDGYSYEKGVADIVTAVNALHTASDANAEGTDNTGGTSDDSKLKFSAETSGAHTKDTADMASASMSSDTLPPYGSSIRLAVKSLAEKISDTKTGTLTEKSRSLKTAARIFIRQNVEKPTKAYDKYADVNKVIWNNKAGIYEGTGKVLRPEKLKELASILGIKYNNASSTGNLYQKLKELGIKGFAGGSKRIGKDQLALTQENGTELIYRASDGAILTPLGQGDTVFTNDMTKRLWEWSQMNPAQFMNGAAIPPAVPEMARTISNGDVNITFGDLTLPDVTNSAEFADSVESAVKNAICKDGRTMQCITEGVSSKLLDRSIGHARLYN